MTLYEYKILPDNIQYEIIWDEGNYIDSRITDNCKINLYAIDMFYVEVYFDLTTNAAIKKVSFKYGERLDHYSNISKSM